MGLEVQPEMVDLKSQEEIYLRLHAQLIRSDPLRTSSSGNRSLERDVETVMSRVKHEGLAFLTKTLPKLGKELDRALVTGRFTASEVFASSRGRSTPAFLQAYFNLVFDEDGLLLDTAPVDAIRHLRQVLLFAYKLEVPYSVEDEARVIESFVTTDQELELEPSASLDELTSLMALITLKVFYGFDHKDIMPRHGPGAVATGELLEEKWKFSRLYDAIHQVYPYYNYYVVGGASELSDRLDWYRSLTRLKKGVAKVCLVPKDSRGPRLISAEPLEYQWIQQGIGRKMVAHLESHRLTMGNINFTHQDINRSLAKISSANQSFATLDLKDASDRVSLGLVRRTFERTPELLRALEACRTAETKLPDGRVVPLRKFAPMGSALCFPVEAYLFWVTIVSAIVISEKLPLEKVGKRVFVYGDDIIVPTEWATLSIQALTLVGLRVNEDKSCITGFFRESCGLDAFKGEEVTPARVRTPWTGRSSDGSALASYVALSNSLSERGYREASEYLWKLVETTYGKMPYGTSRASYPCRLVNDPQLALALNRKLFRGKFNSSFQRLEFLLPRLSSRKVGSRLEGWPRLLRNMISPAIDDPSTIVVPRSMKIKRGWTAVG